MTTYGSVCSGIEAASVAFAPLDWRASWFSEIEPFPCSVLAHHYPAVPNLGDMTTIARRVLTGEVEAPDVLCGGTPCQAFSVAGLRESLSDERGNLTLRFVGLADAIDHVRGRPGQPACIVLWENVPGVFSTKDNAFGCFLAGLAGEDEPLRPPGKKWEDAGAVFGPRRTVAWRTLDAQHFGLAQRRRRVFVVTSARAGFDPCTVLFEWASVRRDTAPRREAGQNVAGTLSARTEGGGGLGTDFDLSGGVQVTSALDASYGRLRGSSGQDMNHGHSHLVAFGGNNTAGPIDVATACNAHGGAGRMDFESEAFIAHSLRGEGFDASEDGTGRGTPLVPVAFNWQSSGTQTTLGYDPRSQTAGTLIRDQTQAIAFQSCQSGTRNSETHATLDANNGSRRHNGIFAATGVRRLTPRECERLQGFPDDYTLIPKWDGWRKMDVGETPESCRAASMEVRQAKKSGRWYVKDVDGPRYKALGNSWAVPCVRWIARRINQHMVQQ